MSAKTPDSHGRPLTVALVVGSLSFALGLVLLTSGVLGGIGEKLLAGYRAAGFVLPDDEVGAGWSVGILFVICYGVAWLLLETPGLGRRILLLFTALLLAVAASPVLALWGVFWCPLVVLFAGAWSGFCAIMWGHHHIMPCEVVEEPHPGKVISMAGRESRVSSGGNASQRPSSQKNKA